MTVATDRHEKYVVWTRKKTDKNRGKRKQMDFSKWS